MKRVFAGRPSVWAGLAGCLFGVAAFCGCSDNPTPPKQPTAPKPQGSSFNEPQTSAKPAAPPASAPAPRTEPPGPNATSPTDAPSRDLKQAHQAAANTATVANPPSATSTSAASARGASTANPPIPTVAPPKIDPTKSVGKPDADKPEYLAVTFNELAGYDYDPFVALEELNKAGEPTATGAKPDAAKADAPKPISNQIPERIRKLNGQKLTVQGFMVPLEVRRNSVKSFLLVRNQMVCCFGAASSFNEWVYVQMEGDRAVKYTPDVLVSVYGTFDLGEDIQDGMVMSIYRVKGVETALKSGF